MRGRPGRRPRLRPARGTWNPKWSGPLSTPVGTPMPKSRSNRFAKFAHTQSSCAKFNPKVLRDVHGQARAEHADVDQGEGNRDRTERVRSKRRTASAKDHEICRIGSADAIAEREGERRFVSHSYRLGQQIGW